MTRLLHRPKRDEDVLLAACTTTRTAPIASTLPTLPTLPLGAPARSVAALRELRTEAPVEPRTLGMRRPSAPRPLPGRDCIAYLTAVSAAIHTDYERHLDTLRVIDDIAASAPDTHTLAMALAPVVAMLKGLVA